MYLHYTIVRFFEVKYFSSKPQGEKVFLVLIKEGKGKRRRQKAFPQQKVFLPSLLLWCLFLTSWREKAFIMKGRRKGKGRAFE